MISGLPLVSVYCRIWITKVGRGHASDSHAAGSPRSGVRTPMGKCTRLLPLHFHRPLLPKPFSEQWRRDSWRRGARLPLDAERGASRPQSDIQPSSAGLRSVSLTGCFRPHTPRGKGPFPQTSPARALCVCNNLTWQLNNYREGVKAKSSLHCHCGKSQPSGSLKQGLGAGGTES